MHSLHHATTSTGVIRTGRNGRTTLTRNADPYMSDLGEVMIITLSVASAPGSESSFKVEEDESGLTGEEQFKLSAARMGTCSIVQQNTHTLRR